MWEICDVLAGAPIYSPSTTRMVFLLVSSVLGILDTYLHELSGEMEDFSIARVNWTESMDFITTSVAVAAAFAPFSGLCRLTYIYMARATSRKPLSTWLWNYLLQVLSKTTTNGSEKSSWFYGWYFICYLSRRNNNPEIAHEPVVNIFMIKCFHNHQH